MVGESCSVLPDCEDPRGGVASPSDDVAQGITSDRSSTTRLLRRGSITNSTTVKSRTTTAIACSSLVMILIPCFFDVDCYQAPDCIGSKASKQTSRKVGIRRLSTSTVSFP